MVANGKRVQTLVLKVLSVVIPVIALAYVGKSVWSVRTQILELIDIGQATGIVVIGGMFYALDSLLLVFAWRHLLNWFGRSNIDWKTALKIYGQTQIVKYIPGNIFHLPSRHIVGRQAGLAHTPLLGAAILEITGLFIASVTLSLLGTFAIAGQILYSLNAILAIGLVAVSPAVLQVVSSRFSFLQKIDLPRSSLKDTYKKILPTWSLYIVFFFVAGIILWWIVRNVSGSWDSVPALMILSIYAVSWLTGMITPGSPAGIGVREAIMIFAISGYLGETVSVVIALLSRLVTILGDVYLFLYTCLIDPVIPGRND